MGTVRVVLSRDNAATALRKIGTDANYNNVFVARYRGDTRTRLAEKSGYAFLDLELTDLHRVRFGALGGALPAVGFFVVGAP